MEEKYVIVNKGITHHKIENVLHQSYQWDSDTYTNDHYFTTFEEQYYCSNEYPWTTDISEATFYDSERAATDQLLKFTEGYYQIEKYFVI